MQSLCACAVDDGDAVWYVVSTEGIISMIFYFCLEQRRCWKVRAALSGFVLAKEDNRFVVVFAF